MTRRQLRSINWFIAAAAVLVTSILIAVLILRDHPIRLLDHMPIRNNDIVLFGDSHFEYFEAAEMFNDRRIRNRGIGGETAADMLERVDDVTRGQPLKVLLLAGANDAFQGRTLAEYLADMRALIEQIRMRSRSLIVLSIPPCRDQDIQSRIDGFNKALRELCEQRHIDHIDLDPVLKKDGLLDPELTTDGVHLHVEGYQRIVPLLKPGLQ